MPQVNANTRRPMALPIYRAWKPDHDETIESGSTASDDPDLVSLDPAYLVPFHFRLEPKFVQGFFVVPLLTRREKANFEEALGRSLNARSTEDLNDAVGRFVAGVGLASRIPPWKAFASHLDSILKLTDELIELTTPTIDKAAPRGIMSASEALKHYLRFKGYQNNLSELQDFLSNEAVKARALASKKGRRGDPSYRLLLESTVLVANGAGDNLVSPGNESKGRWGDGRSSPLSRFAGCVVELACDRGLKASERSNLKPAEKTKARTAFGNLRKKSYGAVLDQLRNAVEAMHDDGFVDRHPTQFR